MLYFCTERIGGMVLVEAVTTGCSEINRFAQPGRAEDMGWPHQVIVDGKLYIRDQENMFCYDIREAVGI